MARCIAKNVEQKIRKIAHSVKVAIEPSD